MTHLEFFHLTEDPFSNLPDTRFFFPCAEHGQALDVCMAALAQSPNCAIVTADRGMGKTQIAHRFAEMLPPETWQALYFIVPNAALTPRGLLRRVCALLEGDGAPPPSDAADEALLSRIVQHLEEQRLKGRQPVLIVDEAQMLVDCETIATLGRLCARRAEGLPHLGLILFGQKDGESRLRASLGLSDLGQIAIHHLEALFPATVAAYVQHRLSRAGAKSSPFTPDALDALHRLSGGAPRRINLLCDAGLVEAARTRRADIDQRMIEHLSTRVEPIRRDDVVPSLLAGGQIAAPLTDEQLDEVDRFLGTLLAG